MRPLWPTGQASVWAWGGAATQGGAVTVMVRLVLLGASPLVFATVSVMV